MLYIQDLIHIGAKRRGRGAHRRAFRGAEPQAEALRAEQGAERPLGAPRPLGAERLLLARSARLGAKRPLLALRARLSAKRPLLVPRAPLARSAPFRAFSCFPLIFSTFSNFSQLFLQRGSVAYRRRDAQGKIPFWLKNLYFYFSLL